VIERSGGHKPTVKNNFPPFFLIFFGFFLFLSFPSAGHAVKALPSTRKITLSKYPFAD
jgi:hypothetical protein